MSTRVRAIEILRPGPPGEGMDPGQVAELEAATIGMPTVVTKNYTRHLSRYASLAAAVADLPDSGADGGEIHIDGEVSWTVGFGQNVLPAKVALTGRGPDRSALVLTSAANPALHINSASGVAIANLSIVVPAGVTPSAGGGGVAIWGACENVTLHDVWFDRAGRSIYADGSMGAVPGTIRELDMRGVKALNSPTSTGIDLADVDGYSLIDVTSSGHHSDGLKLRKKVLNGSIIGGHYNDNGKSGIGGGINGFAGGDSFTIAGGTETARNGSDGISLKSGEPNRTDAANYGYVRRIQISDINSHHNVGRGIDLSHSEPLDLTSPMLATVTVTGGMLVENGEQGLLNNARNVTVTGVHAIRNGTYGFSDLQRAMDSRYDSCVAIANSQSAAGTYDGFLLAGNSGSLVNCLALGADADTIGQTSDYDSLTKYHRYGFRIHTDAVGRWELTNCESRYHANAPTSNGIRVDSANVVAIIHADGTLTPMAQAVNGGIGSIYTKTDATNPEDVYWVKSSGAPNSLTTGWVRMLGSVPARASLPTAALAYVNQMLVRTSDNTLHICLPDGVGGYAWKQVTLV